MDHDHLLPFASFKASCLSLRSVLPSSCCLRQRLYVPALPVAPPPSPIRHRGGCNTSAAPRLVLYLNYSKPWFRDLGGPFSPQRHPLTHPQHKHTHTPRARTHTLSPTDQCTPSHAPPPPPPPLHTAHKPQLKQALQAMYWLLTPAHPCSPLLSPASQQITARRSEHPRRRPPPPSVPARPSHPPSKCHSSQVPSPGQSCPPPCLTKPWTVSTAEGAAAAADGRQQPAQTVGGTDPLSGDGGGPWRWRWRRRRRRGEGCAGFGRPHRGRGRGAMGALHALRRGEKWLR